MLELYWLTPFSKSQKVMVVSHHHEVLFIWTEQCAASHAQCQQRERFGFFFTVLIWRSDSAQGCKRRKPRNDMSSFSIIQAHLFSCIQTTPGRTHKRLPDRIVLVHCTVSLLLNLSALVVLTNKVQTYRVNNVSTRRFGICKAEAVNRYLLQLIQWNHLEGAKRMIKYLLWILVLAQGPFLVRHIWNTSLEWHPERENEQLFSHFMFIILFSFCF